MTSCQPANSIDIPTGLLHVNHQSNFFKTIQKVIKYLKKIANL